MHKPNLTGLLTVRDIHADVERRDGPYSTGWRSLPCMVFNQWMGSDLTLELGQGRQFQVPEGHGFIVGSGCRHNLTLDGRDLRCSWVHLEAWLHGAVDLFTLIDLPVLVLPAVADRLGKHCATLANEGRGGDLLAEARRLAANAAMLAEVLALSDAGTVSAVASRLGPVLEVLVWMRAHLDRPLTRSELSAVAGFSPTRFHYVFKEILGLAPMAYLRQLRLHQAQRLLVESDLAVGEIALACGFSDPFHFSRQFKAASGVAPLVYRRDHRSGLPGAGASRP